MKTFTFTLQPCRPLAAAALLSLGCLPLHAQLRGHIVDQNGQPVAYANVASLQPTDSTVVTACISDETGHWKFRDKQPVKLLRFSLPGYETLYCAVSSPTDSLTITLREKNVQTLLTASVTARRPVARMAEGALITQIENTSLADAGNAADVLKQVPGIIQKGNEEESLEVIGKGEPVIYINGRKMRDKSELKQLRSNEIRQVEVIQSPGAAYDAETQAVVRIRTLRRKGEGWGVNIMERVNTGKYADSETTMKLSYRRNGAEFYLGGAFGVEKSYWNSTMDQHTQAPDTMWFLPMGQRLDKKQQKARATGGLNWDFNENHSVGVDYRFEFTPRYQATGSIDSRILANGQFYDELRNESGYKEDHNPEHLLNVYYAGKIGKGELTVDADLYFQKEESAQSTHETSSEYEDRDFTSRNFVKNRLVVGKAQYEWPWLKGKVTAGTQYSLMHRDDDYFIPENDFDVHTSRSEQREQNAAAFVQYAATLGKRYQLTAGLRYEYATFDYYQDGVYQPSQSPEYSNLFPSFSLSANLGKPQRPLYLMLSYTSRTQRPQFAQLTNNVSYGNRFLLQTGNPKLKPTVTHNVTLTAVWDFLQAVAMYDFYRDDILFWGTSHPQKPAVTAISHINRNDSQLKLMLTAAPQFGFYRPSWTLGYVQSFLEMPTLGRTRKFNNPMVFLQLNNNVKLPAGFDLNVLYNFGSRGNYQNVSIGNCIHYLEAYVTRSFLNKRLMVNIGGEDILDKLSQGAYIEMEKSRFLQKGISDTQRFYIKLQYSLNGSRKQSKSKSKAEEIIRRM